MFQKRNHLLFKYYKNLFCSISFGGKRILRLSESKEKVFSLPNVSKMPKGNVTKERRRRCILAKNLLSPLNSRGWLHPQTNAAKPRVFNASFKDFLNARLQSRSCRFGVNCRDMKRKNYHTIKLESRMSRLSCDAYYRLFPNYFIRKSPIQQTFLC